MVFFFTFHSKGQHGNNFGLFIYISRKKKKKERKYYRKSISQAGGPSGKATRIIFQTSAQLSGPLLTINVHIRSTYLVHQVDVLMLYLILVPILLPRSVSIYYFWFVVRKNKNIVKYCMYLALWIYYENKYRYLVV